VSRTRTVAAGALALGLAVALSSPAAGAPGSDQAGGRPSPIKHLVVIYQENVSFDHYFGTYPKAPNTSGQQFQAARHTPTVNGLANTPGAGGTGNLLTNNPNVDAGGNQTNPRRLNPANINDVLTCDQDHDYKRRAEGVQRRGDGQVPDHRRHDRRQERHRPGVPGQ